MNNLLRLYTLLLQLYPPGFTAAFGDDMLDVFAESLAQARQSGRTAVVGLLLREVVTLPAALWSVWRRAAGEGVYRMSISPAAPESAGLPGSLPPERAFPTPWGPSIAAGLPLLAISLLGAITGLLSMLGLKSLTPLFSSIFGGVLLFSMVVTLLLGLLRGWPRWVAGWYIPWLIAVLGFSSTLLNNVPRMRSLFPWLEPAFYLVFPIAAAWILYRVTRHDRVAGLAAALPSAALLWIVYMEQTPNHIIPPGLYAAGEMLPFALAGLAAILVMRINRFAPALLIALAAAALGGLVPSYAGIYFGGMLPFSEPGPNLLAVLTIYLRSYGLAAALLLGPPLARAVRSLRTGPLAYRVALGGILIMLCGVILTNSFVQPITLIPHRGLIPTGLVIFLAGYLWLSVPVVLAGQMRVWRAALLGALVVGVPNLLLMGLPLNTDVVLSELPVGYQALILAAWTAAAAWTLTRRDSWSGR